MNIYIFYKVILILNLLFEIFSELCLQKSTQTKSDLVI